MLDLGMWALPMMVLTAAAATPAAAQPNAGAEHARPSLVAEHQGLIPGHENWIGIAFEIDPEWHLYWNGVNDSGMPVQVELELPKGFEAGELLWPAPQRLVSPGGILDHVYENRVTLLLPIQIPADAKPGSKATIKADLEWLVCHDVCLPGEAKVSLTLPIVPAGRPPKAGKHAALFEETRSRLPRPAEEAGSSLEVTWEDGSAVVRYSGAESLAFYPATDSVRLLDPIGSAAADSDRLEMAYEMPGSGQPRLVGVLEVTLARGVPSKVYALDALGPMRIDALRPPASDH